MKKLFSLIFCVAVIFSCCFAVKAQNDEYSLSVPQGFVSAEAGSDLKELSRIFGMNTDELQNYFEKHSIKFLAANRENTCQISFTEAENDFSKSVVSFSLLSKEEINELAKDIAGKKFELGGILKGSDDKRYIKLTSRQKDSGGDYTVTEYITVCDAKLYTLNITATDGKVKDIFPEEIFNTLKIKDSASVKSSKSTLYTVLTVSGIIIFALIAIILTVNVVKDLKKKNQQ